MKKDKTELYFLILSLILICIISVVGIYMQDTSLIYILAPVPIIIAVLMYLYARNKSHCPNCGKNFKLEYVSSDTNLRQTISYHKKKTKDMVDAEIIQIKEFRDCYRCKACGYTTYKTKILKQ